MATELGALPEDLLADILRRLPGPTLAAARCVRKAWRAIVDDRELLLPHLLPQSVHGIFVNYIDHGRPQLFARPSPPSASPAVDGMLGFLPNHPNRDWWSVLDHCNGLLLCAIEWETELCVCNPATRQWTVLPKNDEFRRGGAYAYLAFDPAVSPHYEVFLIPVVPEKPSPPHRRRKEEVGRRRLRRQQETKDASFCLDRLFASPEDGEIVAVEEEVKQPMPSKYDTDDDEEEEQDPCRLMEWPPTPWTLQVFSSRTGQWEPRVFIREGEAAGTVEGMRLYRSEPTFHGPRRRYAVCHQGALYVHCRGGYVMRLFLSRHQYQVIETPLGDIEKTTYAKPYLGKSQGAVCFGIVHGFQLSIWVLYESSGFTDWILEYENDMTHHAQHVASLYNHRGQMNNPWVVEEDNVNHMYRREKIRRKQFEWDSDNDDFVEIEPYVGYVHQDFDILGFHPFKQTVFLGQQFDTVAYHLESSKIQYLGYSRPKSYYHNHTNGHQ
ncbi:hypothetical protein ACP4OV_010288 [Aristida adscensionis]